MSCIHGLTFCSLCNGPISPPLSPMGYLGTPPAPRPCEHCWCVTVPFGGTYSKRGKHARAHDQCCQCGIFRLALASEVPEEFPCATSD